MPDSIKFTELPAGTLGANSIFATSEDVGGGVYSSTQINAAALGAYLNNALQYAALNTEDNTIIGAVNELFVYVQNIANEYNSSSTYDEGDFVIYEGILYKCTTAITVAEAWNSAHWTSTLVVDNFGAGGASVTLGTTVPSDATGSNGDLYVQYDGTTYAVIEYFVKINNSWRKAPYSRVVALTQAEYNLITPDPTTLYIITDAQSSYQTKTDNSLATTDKTVVGAINELHGSIGADAYDSTATYNQGDMCIYNNTLYVCHFNNVTGTWDSKYWESTSIAENFKVRELSVSVKTGQALIVKPRVFKTGNIILVHFFIAMPAGNYNGAIWQIDDDITFLSPSFRNLLRVGTNVYDAYVNSSGEICGNNIVIPSGGAYLSGQIVVMTA